MSDPESCRGEGDSGEEVSGEFVVSCGDGPEVFEFVEEALDEVALSIERGIDAALDLSGSQGRDMRGGAMGLDQVEDSLGVVASVGHGVARRRQAVEQGGDAGHIGRLAGAEQEADRQAPGLHNGMDFGRQSAARPADGTVRPPFFDPAAC